MKNNLLNEGLDVQNIETVVSDVFLGDLFNVAHGELQGLLRSSYLRNEYYRKYFNYISPVSVSLGKDDQNIERHYHYVPVKETLQALFKDASVREQFEKPIDTDLHVYTDLKEGSVFIILFLLPAIFVFSL